MIGFDSAAERRGFWRGVLCTLVAVGVLRLCTGCTTAPSAGAAFASVTASDGSTVTLHDGAGPCLGEARAAVWASADRAATVPGCWLMVTIDDAPMVIVSFLDGERGNIPVARLVKVRAS